MLICKGRDPSVNPNLVCLFTLSLVKNTLHPTAPQYITILVLSYDFQALVLFILQASNNSNQNLPNSSFNNRNILHFNSMSIRGIWRDFDTATSKYSSTLQHSSLLLNPSFFLAFIKSSKKRKKERDELELAFWYLNLEGSHFQNFLYLERR